MRHDAEQEYFADGMVEEVITALCRHNRSSHHGSAR
jgi:TolB-like protein